MGLKFNWGKMVVTCENLSRFPRLFSPIRYINDLPDKLKSKCKIFADNTSFFYKIFDKLVSYATLDKVLELSNWAFQWKIQFNPDRSKQAQELYFSKKIANLTFNKNKRCQTNSMAGRLDHTIRSASPTK